jgi:signal transduction histidine kinase
MLASNPGFAKPALQEGPIASLHRGLRATFVAALGCAALLVIAGFAVAWSKPGLLLDPVPAAPAVTLLIIAIVLAHLCEAQLTLLRRLALHDELHRLFSPRDTLEQATQTLARFLCNDCCADSCSIILQDPQAGEWRLYRAARGVAKPTQSGRIDGQLTRPLLAMPAEQAVLYAEQAFPFGNVVCSAYDVASLEPRQPEPDTCAALANLLDARSFASIPLRARGQTIGRIHLGSESRCFTPRDVRFLVPLLAQAALMIENLRLVERLAFEVALEERKRISRDLHDGTIQPYIGLKLGLEALRRKLPERDTASREVDELIGMAGDGLMQLRHYVGRLKSAGPSAQSGTLLPAVRAQARKFSLYYGISTQVTGRPDIQVSARLHDDVLHMVREALSNIRRHTSAQGATISLDACGHRLLIEVVNDHGEPPEAWREFYPRSLGERAEDLGGKVRVERRGERHTAVVIELPL